MKKIIYIWAGCLLTLASCQKDIEVEAPALEVSTASTNVKKGENVIFNFKGNADVISFYPGETYFDYTFKDGRTVDIKDQPRYVQFTSSVQNGSQPNQLAVLISTDFQGDYSFSGIKKATWVDITDRFTLATGATFLSSSLQDITGISDVNKPLYFAFKYLTKPQADNGEARLWSIQNFQMLSGAMLDGAKLSIINQQFAAFKIIDEDPVKTPSRSTNSATRISFQGYAQRKATDPIFDPTNPIFDPNNPIYNPKDPRYNPLLVRPEFVPFDPSSPYNDPQRETWAVSSPVSFKVVDLGPDKSIPIKGIDGGVLKQFVHSYKTPGTYKAHFVISNQNLYNSKNLIKEVSITVTP